jgi:hypothetical protein
MSASAAARRALESVSLVGVLVALGGCGCGKEYDRTFVYADGLVVGNEYQSSTLEGPWLHFPGGRRYRLIHHLGARPTQYVAYLAFSETGVEPGEFSTGSGNSARFLEVTDEHLVEFPEDP